MSDRIKYDIEKAVQILLRYIIDSEPNFLHACGNEPLIINQVHTVNGWYIKPLDRDLRAQLHGCLK